MSRLNNSSPRLNLRNRENFLLSGAEKGATLVEYAAIVSLVCIVALGAISFLGSRSSATFYAAGQTMLVATTATTTAQEGGGTTSSDGRSL